jgi:DNA polymerase-3 subunit beta
MQLSIPTADFASALEIVTRFVSKHATLPILENIYLSTSVDSLTLKGTDMEKHIQLTIPATITQEGAITINAKTLHNIIKTLEADTIDMTLSKDETLTITTSRDNFSIRGIAASEYVALPDVQATSSTTIDTNILIQGISKVEYAVSDKNFSPVLTGILAQTTKNGDQHSIAFAGSDSFRLAEYKTQIPSSDADISVIIPKTNIIEIQKVGEYQIKNEGSDTDISIGDNMISFTFRTDSGIDILVSSLLIQ